MKAIIRKNAAMLAVLAGLAGLFTSPAAQAAERRTLVVAEPVHSTGYLPLYVAIHNGYFAADNLDVKVITVEGGGAHTNAVLTKQAFAFIGGPEHNAFAKIKGAELRAVANVVDRGNVYYVAKTGLVLKPGESMAGFFKGKAIAVSFYGGTPNSITRYLLSKWSLDAKKDVVIKEMSNGAVLAVVKTGNADIGVTTEPILTRGIVQRIWGEPIYNVPKELGPYAYSTLNVRLASIKEEPELVAAFVKGVVKGLKFTYAERDKAVAVAKKEFPTMSTTDLKATLDRSFADELWSKDGMVSPESWKTGGMVVRNAGILKKDVAYDEIIDMQFVKATLAMKK
ncbi:MAG: ABC transporter substrate-binding protein [Rhizobiales bacterium]|nr:ABC transporter substrate-binding protein [Hyphomicrobiales bacterium]